MPPPACLAHTTPPRITTPPLQVGGVASVDDAYRMIRAGATIVQVYTSFHYQGPYLPIRLRKGLAGRLASDGFDHARSAVGVDARGGGFGLL